MYVHTNVRIVLSSILLNFLSYLIVIQEIFIALVLSSK